MRKDILKHSLKLTSNLNKMKQTSYPSVISAFVALIGAVGLYVYANWGPTITAVDGAVEWDSFSWPSNLIEPSLWYSLTINELDSLSITLIYIRTRITKKTNPSAMAKAKKGLLRNFFIVLKLQLYFLNRIESNRNICDSPQNDARSIMKVDEKWMNNKTQAIRRNCL